MKTNLKNYMKIVALLCITLGVFSCTVSVKNDPLANYQAAFTPVKLFPGDISIDGIQWNNAFANDNHEIFYCQQIPGRAQLVSQVFDGKTFSAPQAIPFDTIYNYSDPYINPAADHLIFMSNRPYKIKPDSLTSGFQLWQSFKKNDAWGEPELVFPTETGVGYPWRTTDGTLFYSLQPKDGSRNSKIYFSTYEEGIYNAPQLLPDAINSDDKFEGDAFVAPDKSYIIFASFNRTGNLGFSDLYISFNQGENEWTNAVSLGNSVNSAGFDGSPFVTPDGNFLIFTSSRNSPGNNSFFNHYIMKFDANNFR